MTPNQQVLSDELIQKLAFTSEVFQYHPGAIAEFARAIESAALAALAQQAQEPVMWRTFAGEPDHTLKTDPDAFDAVAAGVKTYEIRKDDRGYKVGDKLLLKRTRYTGNQMFMRPAHCPLEYTGEEARRVVSHIQRGYGLGDDWVILSFATTPQPQPAPPVPAPVEWLPIESASRWVVTSIGDRPACCDHGQTGDCCGTGNGACQHDDDVARAKASWAAFNAANPPARPEQPAPLAGEVTDAEILALAAMNPGPWVDATLIAFARAILALHPAAQPAAQPLPEHADHVSEIAARLRQVAKLAGCPQAVPENDHTAVGAIFSVLGNMRLHLERKQPEPVQVFGIKDGTETLLGTAPMPARMKARELAREQFGHFEDDDGSDAELCFGAMEQLIDHMEQSAKQGFAPPTNPPRSSDELRGL